MTVKVKVWDLPLRLFHWSLVLAVSAAIVTGEIGGEWADWHGRAGLAVLGLVVFRLVWGFIGTTHARFASFFPTPGRILAYLKGAWQGVGHNPLGALSVFALLAIVAAQVGTGLLSNDDIAFEGPLVQFVDKDFSDKMTGWHSRIFWGLATLIGLHVASILFYAFVKKHNLVLPMLTGNQRVPKTWTVTPAAGGLGRFVAAAILSGVAVWSAAHPTEDLPGRLVSLINAHAAAADEEPEPAAF
jgi:cytochrome b